jgi:hypothetical protein
LMTTGDPEEMRAYRFLTVLASSSLAPVGERCDV